MNGPRIDRVQNLFERAARLTREDRQALLAQECDEDESLRAEVESLLEHDLRAEQSAFLGSSQPPADAAADQTGTADETRATDSSTAIDLTTPEIEGYEITRELNRGGQGVVFQAIQKSTRRKVAIKVLREGPYAPDAARRRFDRELSLVASLRHPNIISVFHSGATRSGWQFFVMDYVRGAPLHEHVRAKKLALEEALRLFLEVCDAIQYAHQRGIIHRDLKQTNVIVDTGGVPHVLDFGLAKIISAPDGSMLTLTQEILGTPAYMAPEQFSGNPDSVDTRSDVYALGVVLFELLTGNHPFSLEGGLSRIMRRVTESEPTPPARAWTPQLGITQSTTRRVRGGACPIDQELTTIVMKALSREPQRRYQSVGEFAGDLRHYLVGEPIAARRDSHWYVLRKTLLRHRIAAGFSAAFVAFLIVFCIALLFMYREQNMLRRRAEDTHAFLSETFTSIDPAKVRGKGYTVESLLDQASQRVRSRMRDQPQIAAQLHETIGDTLERLGLFERALSEYEQAVALQKAAGASERRKLIRDLQVIGNLRKQLKNFSGADAAFDEALGLCSDASLSSGPEATTLTGCKVRVLLERKDFDNAERAGRAALEAARRLEGKYEAILSCALTDYATALQHLRRDGEADLLLREALEVRRRAMPSGSEPVLSSMNNLACFQLATEKTDDALRGFTEIEATARESIPESWVVPAAQSGRGACLAKNGRYDEAEELLQSAYDRLRVVRGEHDITTRDAADRLSDVRKKRALARDGPE